MSYLEKYSDEELFHIFDANIEEEIKSRGYEFGWHKRVEYAGVIYILVNPAFPSLVKIGYAKDVVKRLKDLNSNSGLPDPFHVYATYKVKKKLEDLKLHKLIDSLDSDLRHAKNKEFYEMSPEKAYGILSAIAEINGDDDLLTFNPLNDDFFAIPAINEPPEREMSDRQRHFIAFWTHLNAMLEERQYPFSARKALAQHWYDIGLGRSGFWMSMNVIQKEHEARVLFLTKTQNGKVPFDALFAQKDVIEKEFGSELMWRRMDGKLSTEIRYVVSTDFDLDDESSYDAVANKMIDAVIKMRDVFSKYMKDI